MLLCNFWRSPWSASSSFIMNEPVELHLCILERNPCSLSSSFMMNEPVEVRASDVRGTSLQSSLSLPDAVYAP